MTLAITSQANYGLPVARAGETADGFKQRVDALTANTSKALFNSDKGLTEHKIRSFLSPADQASLAKSCKTARVIHNTASEQTSVQITKLHTTVQPYLQAKKEFTDANDKINIFLADIENYKKTAPSHRRLTVSGRIIRHINASNSCLAKVIRFIFKCCMAKETKAQAEHKKKLASHKAGLASRILRLAKIKTELRWTDIKEKFEAAQHNFQTLTKDTKAWKPIAAIFGGWNKMEAETTDCGFLANAKKTSGSEHLHPSNFKPFSGYILRGRVECQGSYLDFIAIRKQIAFEYQRKSETQIHHQILYRNPESMMWGCNPRVEIYVIYDENGKLPRDQDGKPLDTDINEFISCKISAAQFSKEFPDPNVVPMELNGSRYYHDLIGGVDTFESIPETRGKLKSAHYETAKLIPNVQFHLKSGPYPNTLSVIFTDAQGVNNKVFELSLSRAPINRKVAIQNFVYRLNKHVKKTGKTWSDIGPIPIEILDHLHAELPK